MNYGDSAIMDGDGRLLISAHEASKRLGISVRHLGTLTRTGVIPAIKLGKRVLYSVDHLRDWIAQQTPPRGLTTTNQGGV